MTIKELILKGHTQRNRNKKQGKSMAWIDSCVSYFETKPTVLNFMLNKAVLEHGNHNNIHVWRGVDFGFEMLSCEMLHWFSCRQKTSRCHLETCSNHSYSPISNNA